MKLQIRCMSLVVLAVVCTLAGAATGAKPLPAFPGAEGWGCTTPGGRGGKVIFVTSLADRGPGTLREALETKGPRIILFRVSGVIRLKKTLRLGGRWKPQDGDNPWSFVTIAGQSAPGGGVCISGRPLLISNGVHDIVIRHLRFRDSNDDCITFAHGVKRVVMDHCSLSWSSDENIGFFHNNTDVTISYCILAEGLVKGGHHKGSHSCGMLVARGADRISIHHNFFTSNVSRNPLLCGGNLAKWKQYVNHPVFDLRNNLIYNFKGATSLAAGPRVNIVGNVYVHGPSRSAHKQGVFVKDIDDGTRVYVKDNLDPHLAADGNPWSIVRVYHKDIRPITAQYGRKPELLRATEPFPAPAVTTVPAKEVTKLIVKEAGAHPRDKTDLRLFRDFREKKLKCGAPHRTHESPIHAPAPGKAPPDADRDGMPDAWERKHNLNPKDSANCWLDPDNDGYPNLEEYLNRTDPHAP